jgi:site-specific DNA-methyltransferase (cytosine-N4-specific)
MTLTKRLTYFWAVETEREAVTCVQRDTEAEHLNRRARQQRQATRFGVHGFHEYKGKFNPQLARALINAIDPKAKVVADPFAGSGTTLVEAVRLGLHARGRDLSPIAAYIAAVKVDTFTAKDPADIAEALAAFSDGVGTALKAGQDQQRARAVPWLAQPAHDYLREWFSAPAYAGLTQALARHVDPDAAPLVHRLSLLALSSMLRQVSLQEPQDLRIRRRPPDFVAPSLRDAYVSKIDEFLAAIAELRPFEGSATVDMSHGRADAKGLFKSARGRRLVVTSPPYATALPYIDTDRLSLVALGLAGPRALRLMEADLTGSREWSTAEANRWWRLLRGNDEGLPSAVRALLADITSANELAKAGFRRAAVPPLLYRYFTDMRRNFAAWADQLSPGEYAVVVVGRNRTGPRDAQVLIDTPRLLGECATQAGFAVADLISLETWPRFGLHAANGVQAEDALVLRRC